MPPSRRTGLQVFGADYPTPDGTWLRDYIHVVDLAQEHLAALDRLRGESGCQTWNLGTGRLDCGRPAITRTRESDERMAAGLEQ